MTLMSALAMLGALVLAAVVAHGAWTAHKANPRRPDAPADDPRLEPALGGVDAIAALAPDPVDAAHSLPPVVSRRGAQLDPLIDAIVPIRLEQPVSGEMALMHLPPTRRAGTKPFLVEGLNAELGEWEFPQPGQRYGEFQAGVQMANRSGALNQIEYSEFVQKLQPFADAIDALLEPPDMADVVSRAKELDAFASQHDAQLAIRLRANGAAWSVGFIAQCAGRHGFVAGGLPGRLVLPSADDAAPPMLVLSFSPQAALADDPSVAAVREVTLALDVPQTPESAEPFPAWHDAARALAADMDATLIDDQGRPITLHAFAGIGNDLTQLYRALEARDLAAGSAAARRLFS
jgi:hypothetical protein